MKGSKFPKPKVFTVLVSLLVAFSLIIGSCAFVGTQEITSTVVDVPNAPSFLDVPTYDSSGQAVHPDIVTFQTFPDNTWNDFKYWMAVTPYPNGDDSYENPSIVTSNDGFSWVTPQGLQNPVIDKPEGKGSYNADPDLVYNDDSDELWLYFFRYWHPDGIVKLSLMKSSDGIKWSEPQYLITWHLEESDNGRSYSIVKQNGAWYMWYERGLGNNTWCEYRTSVDGVKWSEPQKANISIPDRLVWHLDVYPFGNHYLMLIAAYPENSNAGYCDLFYATSNNRITWDATSDPILANSSSGWDNQTIYRSTFIVDDGAFRTWYSAKNRVGQWHIGYTEDGDWIYQ